MIRLILPAVVLLAAGLAAAQSAPPPESVPQAISAAELADQIDAALQRELANWYPRTVNREAGGFNQSYDSTWQLKEDRLRSVVFQSRMTWVAATIARERPDLAEQMIPHAAHGLRMLTGLMHDPEHGGLFWDRNVDGSFTEHAGDEKNAYGLSFAIYAAAAAHDVLPEAGALDFAIATFRWLDEHAHDEEHGGYFEAIARDGTPLLTPTDSRRGAQFDLLGTPYGHKSMNTHLHLLEAFTELYLRWKDPHLHDRLAELHRIMLEQMFVAPGALHGHYTRDWQPLPGHVSFGHDVEAAYLLIESAEALGMPDDPQTHRAARMLVDQAIRYGLDPKHGGLYSEGSTIRQACIREKLWWPQAEMLNALLLMHALHGEEDATYGQHFVAMWQHIRDRQIDRENGGWFPLLTPENNPLPGFKAHRWKGCYHNGRAMLLSIDRLRALPERLQQFTPPPAANSPEAQSPALQSSKDSAFAIAVQEEPNPWTHLKTIEDPDFFQFAIVSDNAGHERPGIFADAVHKLNLLQPRFVMSIGDFIWGYGAKEPEIHQQWDTFQSYLQPLQMPFFYVAGNHDIANPPMRRVYEERIGRSYYHLVYRNVLFLCLDSQDQARTQISPDQLAYIQKALVDNPDVRWTFVFVHKPIWELNEKDARGWDEVDALLQGRPYTVFSGHVHRYLKRERFGREYYVLGTTGGGSGERGAPFGELDHVVWVSMTPNGPVISNIDINGVHGTDLRTPVTGDIAFHHDKLLSAAPVRLANGQFNNAADGLLQLRNGTNMPAHVTARFDPHLQLHIQPGVINQTLAPGQSIDIPLNLNPLRTVAVEDIAPLRLAGTVQYQPADRAPIDLPIEQLVVIDREWPILEGRSKIAVDGRLDDWPAGLAHRLVLPREVGNADEWHGPDDGSLAFEVRHDDEFVYVAVAVRDDRLIASDHPGEGDYVELWIDGRPRDDRRLDGNWQKALTERQVLRIEVGPAGDGSVQVRNAGDLPEGARSVGTSDEDGWTIEIAIPVGYFIARQGEDWSGARINVLLKDTDQVGQRPATLAWMPDWRWRRNIPGSGTFVRDVNHGH